MGRNVKEVVIPKIQIAGLGDYTRNVKYKTGSITHEFETKTFNCNRDILLPNNATHESKSGWPQAPTLLVSHPISQHPSGTNVPSASRSSCQEGSVNDSLSETIFSKMGSR